MSEGDVASIVSSVLTLLPNPAGAASGFQVLPFHRSTSSALILAVPATQASLALFAPIAFR
jgi:hypothetical protein